MGSTHIEALCDLVKRSCLDVGFAFDGDADRCIAVDSRGNVLSGDEIMFVLASYLKERGELSGNKIVCTVMSNGGLIKSLAAQGIGCEVCAVGDKNVWEEMQNTGAALGGERSGHIVFNKYENTGDGLVTAIMLMEALVEKGVSAGELLKNYKSLPQITKNIPTTDKEIAMQGVAELKEKRATDLNLRIIVRPSGTENLIRVMAEGESEESCSLACAILSSKITQNCD